MTTLSETTAPCNGTIAPRAWQAEHALEKHGHWSRHEPPYLHNLRWHDPDTGIEHLTVIRSEGRIMTPKSGKTRRVDMSTQLNAVLQDWQAQCELRALERGWTEIPP